MIKFTVSRIVLLLLTAVITVAYAAVGDEDVLKAHQAYKKEDAIALSVYAKQLEAQNHILAPYANYWLMVLNLEDIDNAIIANFLEQHSDYPFAQRLRKEYLKKLGKNKDWEKFTQEYAQYQSENAAVACYAAEAYHARPNTGTLMFAKPLWLNEKERPNDCDSLYSSMQAEGVIDEGAIWKRFRMALGGNHVSLAKSIVRRSKLYKSSQEKLLSQASSSPETTLKKGLAEFNTQFGREVNLYALNGLAKEDTWQALNAFKKVEKKFNQEEKSYFYGMLGMYAAKSHEPEAKLWFQKADFSTLNSEQVSWYARAALRQKDWTTLLTVIAQMEPSIADEARWRYWKARALIAGNQNDEAKGILADLATERHYYGWLAQDELAHYKPKPLLQYSPKHVEVIEIGELPSVQRVEALQALDLRWEARLEWDNAIEGFDDKELLAAAEFANRKQWFDLAINTADKTTELHDFSMRYLMPYQYLMKKAAKVQKVDEAWVHGIARQESRFMHYAKSHVGAAGLMQLMPTTARWAAKRAGIRNYKRNMIHDLDTNVTIGTYYLRHTLDVLGGNKVMATAGYNAGPSRAKKWQPDQPLEGAIYAETIPFNETRNYVQRVMANTYLYDQQIGHRKMTLKQVMGTIPAKTRLSASN